MLNLVRGTSKFVTLESKNIDKLFQFIDETQRVLLHGPFSTQLKNTIFERAIEGNTIIFITEEIHSNVQDKDLKYIILINGELECLLSEMMNQQLSINVVSKVKIAPRIIFLRCSGNLEKVAAAVSEDVNGQTLATQNAFDNVAKGTLIYFSCDALHKPNQLESVHHTCVYTKCSYHRVFAHLRNQNLKYLNIGIDNADWFELKIKIYDSYGHFDLHYKRMRYAFEKLEMGMILGETWGKDVASVFQTVGIYKVRFFTFKEPLEIKKVLVGLEYLDDGERICDYDLYWKRKKYHWDQVRTEDVKGKKELGIYYRQIILNQLQKKEKEKMAAMEKDIIATRT